MSMQNLIDAMRLIESNASSAFFAGARSSGEISAAEAALGGAFPPTYREFLERLGAGNFGAFEVYGITDGNFETGRVPNGIWLTLEQRRSRAIPDDFVIVGDTGDGGYYCLALRDGRDGPVYIYTPTNLRRPGPLEPIAADFGEFFLHEVQAQLSLE